MSGTYKVTDEVITGLIENKPKEGNIPAPDTLGVRFLGLGAPPPVKQSQTADILCGI